MSGARIGLPFYGAAQAVAREPLAALWVVVAMAGFTRLIARGGEWRTAFMLLGAFTALSGAPIWLGDGVFRLTVPAVVLGIIALAPAEPIIDLTGAEPLSSAGSAVSVRYGARTPTFS
jgi:hypothetical protein